MNARCDMHTHQDGCHTLPKLVRQIKFTRQRKNVFPMSTLLIIDPDPGSCELLERLCERYGVECLAARGLSEGIRLFKERTVDLIVLDMFLPQKSGLALIAEITLQDHHPPIIATFSAEQAPDINFRKFTHILGAAYTFEKPVNVRLFHQAFLELMPPMKSGDDQPSGRW